MPLDIYFVFVCNLQITMAETHESYVQGWIGGELAATKLGPVCASPIISLYTTDYF